MKLWVTERPRLELRAVACRNISSCWILARVDCYIAAFSCMAAYFSYPG